MAALVFENVKLILLFLLIGTIIGFSHLDGKPKRTVPGKRRTSF
jgi:hypothetical protein